MKKIEELKNVILTIWNPVNLGRLSIFLIIVLAFFMILLIFYPQSGFNGNLGRVYFANLIAWYPAFIFLIIFSSLAIFFAWVNKCDAKILYFTALFTLFIILGSLPQFYNLVLQSNADYLLKIKNALYEKETSKKIMQNIDDYFDCLYYAKNDIKYNLLVKKDEGLCNTKEKDKSNGIEVNDLQCKEVSGWELDEYLLLFEHIGALVDDGLINKERINDFFGWYITRTWKHPEVQCYVKKYQERKDPNLYRNFVHIANELIKIEDKEKQNSVVSYFNNKIEFKQTCEADKCPFPKDRSYEIRDKDKKNVMFISECDFERYGKEDIITKIRTKLN